MSMWKRLFGGNDPREEFDEWWGPEPPTDPEPEPEPEPEGKTLTHAELLRRLLHDAGVADVEYVIGQSGEGPCQSPEVDEMSQRESSARMAHILPVVPAALFMSDVLSDGVTVAEVAAAKESGILGIVHAEEADVREALRARSGQVRAYVLAVLSNLVDLGVLQVTGGSHVEVESGE